MSPVSNLIKGRGLKLRRPLFSARKEEDKKRSLKGLFIVLTVAAVTGVSLGKVSLQALGASGDSWSFVTGAFMHTVDIDLEDKGLTSEQVVGEIGTTHEVVIRNRGASCWIRISTSIVDRNGAALLINEVPEGQEESYRKCADGYIYRIVPLDEGEWASWQEAVLEPDNDLLEGTERTLVTQVEAIQAQNFTPKFESDAPWDEVAPEPAIWQVQETLDARGEVDDQ